MHCLRRAEGTETGPAHSAGLPFCYTKILPKFLPNPFVGAPLAILIRSLFPLLCKLFGDRCVVSFRTQSSLKFNKHLCLINLSAMHACFRLQFLYQYPLTVSLNHETLSTSKPWRYNRCLFFVAYPAFSDLRYCWLRLIPKTNSMLASKSTKTHASNLSQLLLN